MYELPHELAEELSQLESAFTIQKAKLKKITDRFIEELEDGKHGVPLPFPISQVPRTSTH